MKYYCSICGYVFDEEKEGKKLSDLEVCPVCKQPVVSFIPAETEEEDAKPDIPAGEKIDLSYPQEYTRTDNSSRYMKEIHQMAVSGESIIETMGTKKRSRTGTAFLLWVHS